MTARHRLLAPWIEWWLAVSSVLCALDVTYTMSRPHTNRGGILERVFEPWNIYADVDYRYAEWDDIVTMGTGRVMLIEIVMNLLALILARRGSRHAVLLAFTSSAFVFWKTFWYMVLYIRQPEGTRPFLNPNASFLQEFMVFWVIDGIWCLIPFLVMVALWNRLAKPEFKIISRHEAQDV